MGTVAIWRAREFDGARAVALEATGLPPTIARILASRGLTAETLEAFFDPSLARLAAAESLPGVAEAVRVILPFLRDGREIVVFGDYDVDGVSASAILVSTLKRLGARVDAFIPRRFGEGYGLTQASLTRLFAEHPEVRLVVTVDNGITSPDEVAALRARGVTVVVTDHHLPGAVLPQADALVDPQIRPGPGCDCLCGAGVAFFLASALAKAAREAGLYAGPKFAGSLLVLAGLATVADVMPVTGQNRVLVAQSLALFNHFAPLGLRELLARAARSANALVARDYGFALSPRINAAGRMDDARRAYDLLMNEDRELARTLAFEIDKFNVARKTVEQQMDREAREQIGAAGEALPALVVRGEGWHLGVAGIVASRLLDSYHVPVAVVVGDVGSVRAPEGYNVHDALAAAGEHLSRFGGHALAGGFTVREGAFEAFRAAFMAACARQKVRVPEAAVPFDGWVEPSELTLAFHEELKRLEPFGEGNPEPVLGLRRVALREINVMGGDGRHLSLSFVNRAIPRAIWWGHGEDAELLRAGSARPYDVLFTLTSSDFGTEGPHPELRVVALRLSE
ncbi:MAG: single-stranded-DNA-specific exonuclease RecJ [Kiritimatiellia bacterium]